MRDDLVIRAGFYYGLAVKELGDRSYAERFIGHAEDITEEIYHQTTKEICDRLIAAGKLKPDEDPYETFLAGVQKIEIDE